MTASDKETLDAILTELWEVEKCMAGPFSELPRKRKLRLYREKLLDEYRRLTGNEKPGFA